MAPGAIFWMWVVALIGMATSFIESTLAQLYKTRDDGNYRGGPAYYMERGLKARWMGVLFSVFLIIAFGLVFNAVQANSIAQASKWPLVRMPVMSVPCWWLSLRRDYFRRSALDCPCGGAGNLPVMAVAYLILAFWVMGHYAGASAGCLYADYQSAFGLEAVSGAVGYGVAQAMD